MKNAGRIMTALLLRMVLFALPRTGPLGAVLFTGLLGGAVASHTLFGIYLGVFMWVALYLRDPAFRAFIGGYLSGKPGSGAGS
jgi:hypothetical protein